MRLLGLALVRTICLQSLNGLNDGLSGYGAGTDRPARPKRNDLIVYYGSKMNRRKKDISVQYLLEEKEEEIG